ncbi:hypothetical protein ST37_03085 [Vibrio sp. qd031]|uniref:hypothetical protein n=1 Tax=Vibrio sp. qd031 TaxID=1603038 RepID=UPI000A117B0F|nr:hypothetical protein [Vibrio sp. qd031]ORT52016.1 hypothetical protein ST37_03085 [Vibrio sp. qd031]
MSVVNNALSKISEQNGATPHSIEKAEIPAVKHGVSPFIWVGIGVCVSLAIGSWAMTANQSSPANEVLVASQPNETQKVIVEVEPLVVHSDPIVEVTTAPTQKTALDTDVVTVYSLATTAVSSENDATLTAPVTSTVEKKSASTESPQPNTTKAAVVNTAVVAPKNTVPPQDE